jgi:hypothetical protein
MLPAIATMNTRHATQPDIRCVVIIVPAGFHEIAAEYPGDDEDAAYDQLPDIRRHIDHPTLGMAVALDASAAHIERKSPAL